MPKESSSKKPALDRENSVVKHNGTFHTPKKPCNEMDEIFSSKKRKKSEQEKTKKKVDGESVKAKKPKKKKNKNLELKDKEYREPPSRPRMETGDGLVICTEEELRLGKSDPPKKTCNEIDEIFSSKKRKKSEQEKVEKQVDNESAKAKKLKITKNKRMRLKEKDYRDPPSRPRKKTGDGLVVYTEEELGLGKSDAGGTPLCPFDCDCCF